MNEAKKVSQKLSCCIDVVLSLLRIKAKLPLEQFEILKSYFSSNIDIDSETGWEEATLASLQHINKTCLH